MKRAVLAAMLGIVLVLARQPGKLAFPQLWAEDGAVFFAEAERLGLSAVLEPYSGYWHAFPRIVAVAGRHIPVFWVPTLYTLSAVMVLVLLFGLIGWGLLGGTLLDRYVLIAIVAMAPYSQEVWLTLTNVQWPLALVLIAALASDQTTSGALRCVVLVSLVVSGLTGPFALVLLPIAVLRLWWCRDGWSLSVCAVLLACAAVTTVGIAQHPRGPGPLLTVDRVAALVDAARARKVVAGLGLAGLSMVVYALCRGWTRRDWRLVAVAGAGVLLSIAPVMSLPIAHLQVIPQLGGRYVFLPWTCLGWSVWWLFRTERTPWLPAGVSLVLFVLAVYKFPIPPLARHDWTRDAACLEQHTECDVTLNPAWRMGLPGRGGRHRVIQH